MKIKCDNCKKWFTLVGINDVVQLTTSLLICKKCNQELIRGSLYGLNLLGLFGIKSGKIYLE